MSTTIDLSAVPTADLQAALASRAPTIVEVLGTLREYQKRLADEFPNFRPSVTIHLTVSCLHNVEPGMVRLSGHDAAGRFHDRAVPAERARDAIAEMYALLREMSLAARAA